MAKTKTDSQHEVTQETETELPEHWKAVQGAIWMVGIAVLAITGWWWPGIMILVAISMLAEAGIRLYVRNQAAAEQSVLDHNALQEQRRTLLPDMCPSCGSPTTVDSVNWVGPLSARCTFCGNTVTTSPQT